MILTTAGDSLARDSNIRWHYDFVIIPKPSNIDQHESVPQPTTYICSRRINKRKKPYLAFYEYWILSSFFCCYIVTYVSSFGFVYQLGSETYICAKASFSLLLILLDWSDLLSLSICDRRGIIVNIDTSLHVSISSDTLWPDRLTISGDREFNNKDWFPRRSSPCNLQFQRIFDGKWWGQKAICFLFVLPHSSFSHK